jgi:hypothetical protein
MVEHKTGDLVRPTSEAKDTLWRVVGANGRRCVAVREDIEPDEDTPRKAWGNNDRVIPLDSKEKG